MLPVEYQMLSKRTAPNGMDKRNIALGLIGEGGEVADLIKKFEFHKHPVDKDKLVKEIGDFMWYFARLLDYHGTPFAPSHMSFDFIQRRGAKLAETKGIVDTAIAMSAAVNIVSVSIATDVAVTYEVVTTVFNNLCSIVNHYDLDLEYIATANVAKLMERYPEGFSSEASVKRVDMK